jgi:hypothetical protein
LKAACLGALAFWGPNTIVHAVRRNSFDSSDVLIITTVMPVAMFVAISLAAKAFHRRTGALALPVLAGVWLLGGLFMMTNASFAGGGFASFESARDALIVFALSLLPMYTFIMATYDGSLGALILVTLVLMVLAVYENWVPRTPRITGSV